MNRPNEMRNVFASVDLAREVDFELAQLSVRPSLCRIVRNGREEAVQPRVMQVLVALVRAKGTVVSRDELIESCWEGVIVGDDSITRCITKVRQLADCGGVSAFEVETIPRVGYRLVRIRESYKTVDALPVAPSVMAPLHSSDAGGIDVACPRRALEAGRRAWAVGSLAIAFVVIVAAIVYVRWSSTRQIPLEWMVVESHLPFIASPLTERTPDISPNGSTLAYSAGPDAFHRGIYLRLLSGGESVQLVAPEYNAYSPVWSPDGSEIAFNSYAAGQPCRIMLVAALGGQSQEVGRCRTARLSALAWDRTNGGILFSDSTSVDVPSAIYRLDLNGGPLRQLTFPFRGESLEDQNPTISPDGKALAFRRVMTSEGKSQIRIRSLATGAENELYSGGDGEDGSIAWSNDSKTLFIAKLVNWDSSLWSQSVGGGAPQRIMASPLPISGLSSGPGGLLAVSLDRSEWDIATAPASPAQPIAILDPNAWGANSLDYSRDGTLAAIAPRSGATSLLIGGRDGVLREVYRLKGNTAGQLHWSPDGLRLAFLENGEREFQITIIDRQGRILQHVPWQALDMSWLDWDSDGKGIIITSLDAHGWAARRFTLDRPDRLTPIANGWMHVIKRGSILLGSRKDEGGIWRIDGAPRQLTAWPGPAYSESAWTATDDSIVYPDFSKPDAPVFMSMPLAGGTPRVIGYAENIWYAPKLAVNPKTGLVTYVRRRRTDSDIGWLRVVEH